MRVSKENYYLDIAATVAEALGVTLDTPGKSFLKEML